MKASSKHYENINELTTTLAVIKNRHMYPWFTELREMSEEDAEKAELHVYLLLKDALLEASSEAN